MQIDDSFRMDDFMPAIVVGRCGAEDSCALVEGRGEPPAFLTWWNHQYGGYACLQASVTGIVLPLGEVSRHEASLARVISGLQALGECEPHGEAMARFPELRMLHLTSGQPYDRYELVGFADFLQRDTKLPAPLRGEEALVQLDESDLLGAFGGWPMVTRQGDSYAVGAERFEASPLAALRAWLLPSPDEPAVGAYLVWFNSD